MAECAIAKSMPIKDEVEVRYQARNSSSVSSQQKHYAIQGSKCREDELVESTRCGHPVRSRMKSETDEPFYSRVYSIGSENDSSSNNGRSVLQSCTSFDLPSKPRYPEEEKMELQKKVYEHELQDQLNRTNILEKIRSYYHVVNEVGIRHDLDNAIHPGSYNQGRNLTHQRQTLRIPFSAEPTVGRHQVDCSCFHGYPQDCNCLAPLPSQIRCNNSQYTALPKQKYFNNPSTSSSPQHYTGSESSLRSHEFSLRSHDAMSDEYRHAYHYEGTYEGKMSSRERHQPVKRHVLPLAGGAPFVVCYKCSELLQLPADFLLFGKRCHRLRCGACAVILKFSLQNGSHILPPNSLAPSPSNNVEAMSCSDDCGPSLSQSCSTEEFFRNLKIPMEPVRSTAPWTDFDAADNSAHLGGACQSGPVVSLSGNENRGEASKRECITERILGLEDLQQNSGGRRDNAAESFGAIYDPGIHTTHSLAQNSIEVLEALPTLKQPNDCVPLLSLGRLKLEGCVQEEKSQDLPRLVKINGVEQRVTKSPSYLGGFTAQSTSSSRWPISLPDGRHIVVLNPLEQSTKNVAHVARAPSVSLPEKMVRRTVKRKCRIMRVIYAIHQQHFGKRCEGTAKSFRAMHICRNRGINWVSTVKRIHKQHGNNQWPFRQKWATRKGYSLREKRPYEVSSQSMDENLVSKFLFIHMSQFPTFSPLPLALPNSSEIVGPIALSSDEFAATNNRAHLVRQNQCGSTASHYKRKNTRETLGRQRITESLSSIEDLQQHFARKHKDAVKRLGVKVSIFKSSCRQHRVYWLPCQIIKSEQQAFDATSNIAHVVKADQGIPTVSCSEMENKRESLKRECSGLSLEDLPEHYGGRHEDAMKGLGEKKMVRRTLKRKYRIMSLIFSIHQQHFGKRSEGTAKSFHAMRICRNHGINCVSMVKCIHKQHGINQWPFRQKWATRKGHSLGEKRPYEVSTLSMDMPRSLKLDCSRGLGAQFAVGLPDGGYVLSVSEKKIVEKTLKRKCKTMSLFSLEDDQQHGVRRWGDAAKSLGRKRICRQLVVQHVSRAKRIHRQHVFHRWPFQQNWETMKAYSVRDKRPAEVLSLSTDGKLVSRLQLVHISWLVKFLPRPSAYGGGGEIVGPIALLSSEFAATNNRAHGIRNDQSGSSSASHFEEEIPGEPVDVEGTGSGISLEELQQLFDKKREDAAKSLKVSVSTFKRICRQHGIKPWPYQARKKAVKKPPDRHRGMNTTGSSDDQRNLSASQEEPLLRGHVSGPIYRTIPTCTDPAPGQPTPIVPHPTGNLLASEEEVLLRGHVSGPIYGRISSRTDPAPSQTTPIVPHPTGNLEDQRNLLALPEELLLSQRTPSIHPAMDGFAYWGDGSALFDDFFPEGHASGSLDCAAPACSNPAPSQTMPTNATEMQNMDFVELKATYDDATFGNTTIKFQLPPKFETSELEEKVSKILKCELDSFRVEYKDKDEEWILMGCDENVREYLQLLNSLGNQVTKLKITKVPNTNLCEACGSSLTRKRPRHV